MTDLSPAAHKVIDAFLKTPGEEPMTGWNYRRDIAAALRAAVDQVVPEHREHHPNTLDERYRKVSVFDIRNQFLAIAAQLDSTSQQS
jgi:hypothetical protein